MSKIDCKMLRTRVRIAEQAMEPFPQIHIDDIRGLLDALDEALAEKEHYETLAETCGEQRDEAERKLAEGPTTKPMGGCLHTWRPLNSNEWFPGVRLVCRYCSEVRRYGGEVTVSLPASDTGEP